MTDEERLAMIMDAVYAQADDPTLWGPATVGEAYVTQSLRWLHRVIEQRDEKVLRKIVAQSKGKDHD